MIVRTGFPAGAQGRAENRIRQIAVGAVEVEGTLSQFTRDRVTGVLFRSAVDGLETLILPTAKRIQTGIARIIKGTLAGDAETGDLTEATWLRNPAQTAGRVFDYKRNLDEVQESWTGCFSYIQESVAGGRKGLRTPQIGAIHAVHAHWTTSSDPATIVMPTGTGKTEVMLSVLVSAPCANAGLHRQCWRSKVNDTQFGLGREGRRSDWQIRHARGDGGAHPENFRAAEYG
jgi:hypothetical protein